jgi:hypothetical protein
MSDCEQMEFQLSTSSPAASRAKTFQQPVAALELKVSVRDYGLKFAALLASYDPYTQSWKTSGTSLLARTTNQADGSDVFSATWPRSGMMRNGIAYRLRRLVPNTTGKESGLWPTPLKTDGFTIGQFSVATQASMELKGYQQRFWTRLALLNYSPEAIARISERMLGYPERWTELEP